MSITKVTRNFQVTIPVNIRKAFRIKVGTVVDFVIKKGVIIMKPKALVDEDQAWFWTEEWQKGERKADEDVKAGRVKKFKSAAEAVKHLESKG